MGDPARAHPAPGRLTFLLVDDHRLFTEALAMRLEAEPSVAGVHVAHDLATARQLAKTMHPDVVLLDLKLAGESGLDLLPELDKLPSRPPVLMLSAAGGVHAAAEALEAGAQGWLTKDASVEELIEASRELRKGHTYIAPGTVQAVLEEMLQRSESGPPRDASFLDNLSPRETEVLRCLMAGMSRTEIAERLHVSVNTVRTHVQHLLRRSGEHSTLALVAHARRLGLLPMDDETDQS